MRKVYILFLLLMISGWLVACGQSTSLPPPPTLSPQAKQGKELFTRECASCHSLSEETIIVGPSLHKIAERAKERVPNQDAQTYLLASIIDPDDYLVDGYQDLMPVTFGKRMTGEEIDAVVAYLLTLD